MLPIKLLKWIAFILSLLPLLIIILGIINFINLGPNIVEAVLHRTGNTSLNLLMIVLLLPLIAKHSIYRNFIVLSRMLGLFSFFYAVLHLCVYLFIDRNMSILSIQDDFISRPYILAGMIAFLSITPLAMTSFKRAQIRLKGLWKKIHQLVYLGTASGIIHYIWQMKIDLSLPMLYLVGFLIILELKKGFRAT